MVLGTAPVSSASNSSVRRTSSRNWRESVRDGSPCDHVWFPTSCPSSAMRRTKPGCRDASSPITKKVAFSCRSARASSNRGVCSGCGPSSKVSARRGAVPRAARGPCVSKRRRETHAVRTVFVSCLISPMMIGLSLRRSRKAVLAGATQLFFEHSVAWSAEARGLGCLRLSAILVTRGFHDIRSFQFRNVSSSQTELG